MLPHRTLHLLIVCAPMCVAALPGIAQAQSVTINTAAFQFQRQVRRPDGQLPNWISRRDCLEDEEAHDDDPDFQRARIRISPRIEGARTGWELQVWAGSNVDCTEQEQRTGVNTARCWPVGQSNSPNQAIVQLDISPRAIAAGAGITGSTRREFAPTDPEACNQPIQIPITLFFMLVNAGNIQGTVARWEDTSLDLLGPPAPTNIRAGIGEDKLIARWEVPIEGDFDDIDGFALYCDEAGGTPPPLDDGTAGAFGMDMDGMVGGDGMAGGDGMGAGACTSSSLVPGRLPPLDLHCGTIGGRGSREGRARGLENGVTYALAVAGVDLVGNSGPLSALACGTPQPVTSFFEAYREAGGNGGGGFCSWAPPSPPGAFAGILVASGLWWSRRRRRRG